MKKGSMVKPVLMETLLILLCSLLFSVALAIPLAFAETALTPEEQSLTAAYAEGQLIRLHVVANSDSAEDQRIKLLVRDALIEAFGDVLREAGATGYAETCRALEKNAVLMERTALDRARQEGFLGSVHAEVGLLPLPEKQYGQVLLPAGEYYGLRVVLGSGEGQNWWCVLFPQLCLAVTDDGRTEPAKTPEVAWDSSRILACWLAYAPDSATDTAETIDLKQPQRANDACKQQNSGQ
ncbi:MAG: stage II sporulation protein R [Eubacteriales bacterium]|nr:stage II sporulation protein R [Eubacteriales bacterium]